MANWLRTCTLSVGNTQVQGGGLTDLRIVFSITMWHAQAPNMARFRIYNASPTTTAGLQAAEGSAVSFSAGYQGNIGPIFSGQVKQTIAGHETAVDSYVDVFAADADTGYNQGVVNKSLASGWTPNDKLQAAVQAMGKFGVSMGTNTLDLSKPKYPRGIAIAEMARDTIRHVVLSAGGLWSIQSGKVMITDKTLQGGGNGAVSLGPTTGLIGWPKQTADGIFVRSLLNPALQPLQQIKLDPSSIIAAERNNNEFDPSSINTNESLRQQMLGAGTYTIYKIDRSGDTRGQDWYDDSTCIGLGGSLPQNVQGVYALPYS